MAGTTTTLTNASPQYSPRALHSGIQMASQDYKYNGTTLSASDMLLAIKIPRNSRIVDWMLCGNGGATTTTFKIGLQGVSDTALGTAVTLSATDVIRRAGAIATDSPLPVTITTSDDAANLFRIVQLLATSVPSATVTGSFTLSVFYAMDGSN